MSFAIGYVGDEVQFLSIGAIKHTVNGLDYHLDDVNAFPIVEAAYVVGVSDAILMENKFDGSCMVFYKKNVIDEQWYQFF